MWTRFRDNHDDVDGDGVKEFYLDSLYIFQFGMLLSESINAIWKYKMNNSLKLWRAVGICSVGKWAGRAW